MGNLVDALVPENEVEAYMNGLSAKLMEYERSVVTVSKVPDEKLVDYGTTYDVEVTSGVVRIEMSCTCPDFKHRKSHQLRNGLRTCKHVVKMEQIKYPPMEAKHA